MQDGTLSVVGLDDRPGWDAASRDGLPSHSWHYAAGLAEAGLIPRLAILQAAGARMILPFHVRPWRGFADMATLPGLSGALVLPAGAEAGPLFALWRAHALAEGWVSGYLQLSPRNPGITAPAGDVIAAHNALFEFDLDHWQFERDIRRKVRWALRAGEREGARLVTSGTPLEEAVLRLYPEAMARLGGETFPARTLETWFEDPGIQLFGAEIEGRIEAVELCRWRGAEAELHLAGSSDRGRGLHGWLIWQMAEWFRGQGVRIFNIGGYGREGDGLHDMKRRLGTLERPMRSLRQVYRPDLYARLCAEAGADPGQLYFPAYRGPQRGSVAPTPDLGG